MPTTPRRPEGPATVVIATRDRAARLLRSLDHLLGGPDPPAVVVVDNGSHDGTPEAVAGAHPGVRVVRLGTNLGAAARNVGVALATTPVVAFADDDSWWAPGSLGTARAIFDRHPDLAVLAGRIVVEPSGRTDPVCETMAASPLATGPDDPGPRVLGFVACGAVVRRSAFLAAGGFSPVIHFPGEESTLAWDLAAAGWACCYVDDVLAHHHPGARAVDTRRRRLEVRNEVLSAALRRPWTSVARTTIGVLRAPAPMSARVGGVADAARRAGALAAGRDVLPGTVEADLRLLDRALTGRRRSSAAPGGA